MLHTDSPQTLCMHACMRTDQDEGAYAASLKCSLCMQHPLASQARHVHDSGARGAWNDTCIGRWMDIAWKGLRSAKWMTRGVSPPGVRPSARKPKFRLYDMGRSRLVYLQTRASTCSPHHHPMHLLLGCFLLAALCNVGAACRHDGTKAWRLITEY